MYSQEKFLIKESDSMNTATCDKCDKEFVIDIKEHDHCEGIIETYFDSNHCNHRYSTTYTNGIIRDLIKKFANE